MLCNTEHGCKSVSFVVSSNVTGFLNSGMVLMDSAATSNYACRRSLKGIQPYDEVMRAQVYETITVRLSRGTFLTVPKVAIHIDVKVLKL